MKLLVAGLVGAALAGVVVSARATSARVPSAPPPRINSLQFCLSGAVELVEERCLVSGGCAMQSVRLAWSRGAGTLYAGDASGEKVLRQVDGAQLSRLVGELTSLEPLETDQDRGCLDCAGAERALTITTDCSGRMATSTFMKARPVWERVREAGANCLGSDVQCLAVNAWHATFATHLASRFGAAFQRIQDAGRSR